MAETGKFIILGESDRTVTDILSSGHKGQPDPDETDEDGYSSAQTFIIDTCWIRRANTKSRRKTCSTLGRVRASLRTH